MSRFFPITSICKEDILMQFMAYDEFELIKDRVEQMDDHDMQQFAKSLANAYCEDFFWSSLETIFLEKFYQVSA